MWLYIYKFRVKYSFVFFSSHLYLLRYIYGVNGEESLSKSLVFAKCEKGREWDAFFFQKWLSSIKNLFLMHLYSGSYLPDTCKYFVLNINIKY